MDVSRAAEEREHAEREAHDETEKIEISPGHRTPQAHPCASWSSRPDPTTQFCSDAGGGCPLPSWPPLRRCPELKTSPSRSARPGVRRISASSSTALRESCTSAMASSARCSSGSAVNCSAPAKSHESIFASIARNSDCKPGVYPSGSSTRNPGYTRKNRASSSRVVCVRCGRAPLSICERYAWLNPRPISRFIAAASSCWVIERLNPRSEPSTERRERSLSPSFMVFSLIAICKYHITYRYFVKRNRIPFLLSL